MPEFLSSTTLLLVLLNPFLVIIYLIDIIQKLDLKSFVRVMIRAGAISTAVFCCFAVLGDTIFTRFMNARFASFQVFGGVVFLLVGIQFVFQGGNAIELLRGESEHLAGAIAMPVLIGPGTVSASVLVGERLGPLQSCLAVAVAVYASIAVMVLLKALHDYVRPRNERLVQRYIEITGRITALFIGTYSVQMIMQGILAWFGETTT